MFDFFYDQNQIKTVTPTLSLLNGLILSLIYVRLYIYVTYREALEDYYQRDREVIINLAKAVSKTLGFEENYLEKEFELETGADVSAMNVYPPGFKPNTQIGLPAHYDPGYLVSLVQNVNGGLQLNYKQKWINVDMPSNALFINIGDHVEVHTY